MAPMSAKKEDNNPAHYVSKFLEIKIDLIRDCTKDETFFYLITEKNVLIYTYKNNFFLCQIYPFPCLGIQLCCNALLCPIQKLYLSLDLHCVL
jgi:hypothetical protein